MMAKNCFIVEDLLPLYHEDLLSDETEIWMKDHLEKCPQCSKLERQAEIPMTEEKIPSPINHEKMMTKINLKISLYQMIFIGISFFLALNTALLNDSFGFILSYAVLGLVIYLFYKSFLLTSVIAFLPIFIWSLGTTMPLGENEASNSLFNQLLQGFIGSIMLATIHLTFALIGALIGWLALKLREGRDSK